MDIMEAAHNPPGAEEDAAQIDGHAGPEVAATVAEAISEHGAEEEAAEVVQEELVANARFKKLSLTRSQRFCDYSLLAGPTAERLMDTPLLLSQKTRSPRQNLQTYMVFLLFSMIL